MYCANRSSVSDRCSTSDDCFASGEAGSNGGTTMSVTRNTMRSVALSPSAMPAPPLGDAEDLTQGAKRETGHGIAALERGCGLQLELVRVRNVRKRRAQFELVEHLGGLGLEPRGDLVVAPARFDLSLDLVERAVA